MNNKCILLFYFLTCSYYAVSQHKYKHNWYFGNKAALDFNTNPPTIKTDNKMNAENGS